MREKGGLLLEVGRIHNRPSWEFATALHFTTVTASGNRETQMNQAEHTGTEYLKLQRSAADAKVFDLVEPVFDRYTRVTTRRQSNEVWKFDRQVPVVAAGTRHRIQANSRFQLHWTTDEWQYAKDTWSTSTALGIEFVDLHPTQQRTAFRCTFFWPNDRRWEGKDYRVEA